jgi:hypothetical protein
MKEVENNESSNEEVVPENTTAIELTKGGEDRELA